MIFGHIAISLLLHRYLGAELTTCVAGGLAPDVVDKTLCQVLHLTPSGRMHGHTLIALGLSTAVVWVTRGRRSAIGWMAGYTGHLLGDVESLVPWFHPFVKYDFRDLSPSFGEIWARMRARPAALLLELSLLSWALLAMTPGNRGR